MSICERIFAYIDSSPGKSPAGLAKALGVTTSQTTNWKKRNTDPPVKYVVDICKYLEVPVMWLLCGEDGPEISLYLDERERNLIEHYRALDLDGKSHVESLAAKLHEQVRLEGDNHKAAQ